MLSSSRFLRRNRLCSAAGLTLLEALIVIALFAAVLSMAGPLSATSLGQRKTAAAAELVSDSLRQAQFSAMSSRGSKQFGVHFESDRFVFYRGAAYNPADTENDVRLLDDDVSLSYSLSGGADEVHFDNHRGLPSATGTVTVSSSTGGQDRTVTIGEEGAIGE